MTQTGYPPLLITIVLVIIVALRMVYMPDLIDMTPDEVWSVWQTLGSPQQILLWTPFDWPPGYYLILGAWRWLTGLHPITLRFLNVLTFTLGAAAAYRVGARWFNSPAAGVLTMTYYSVSEWSIFISLHLRGHSFVHALAPLALWLALRYVQFPNWRRGLLLSLLLGAMFYLHVTVVFFYAALGIVTVVRFGPRALRRWLFPALTVIALTLPQVLSKLSLALSSRQALQTVERTFPPFPQSFRQYLEPLALQRHEAWYPVLIVAGLLLLWRLRHADQRRYFPALLVWFVFPLILLHPALRDFFTMRYTSWYAIGFSLLIAGGLSTLRPPFHWGAVAALLLIATIPYNVREFDQFGYDLGTTFQYLADHMQDGDVILVDSHVRSDPNIALEEWDLYSRAFFPNGIPIVDAPHNHRRVWYVQNRRQSGSDFRDQLDETHVRQQFVGEPHFFTQLYHAPPHVAGIRFDNGMRYHGTDILHPNDQINTHYRPIFHEQETVRVRVWWSVDSPLGLDYSTHLHLFDTQNTSEMLDDAPQMIAVKRGEAVPPAATSQWETGRYYVQEYTLTTTPNSAALMLVVYQWWDNTTVPAGDATNANTMLPARLLAVRAW